MRFWVVFLAVLGRKTIKKVRSLKGVFMRLSVRLLGLFLVRFYVSDFIFFYLGFEGCLIPIFFIVLG